MPAESPIPPSQKRMVVLLTICLLLLIGGMHASRRSRVRFEAAPAPAQQLRGPYIRSFPIMGTHAMLKFWAAADQAEAAADAITLALQRLQNCINLFDDRSELAQLNARAAQQPVVCSDQLWQVLLACRQAYAATDGLFDVSVGPLMRLWGFHRQRQTWPDDRELAAARAAVGLDKVVFDDALRTVEFRHPQAYLDMGGIAKGYGLEIAVALAHAHGVRCGIIDLGGNIFCLEEPPPGKPGYVVGIRNPFDRDNLLGNIELVNTAVATSGDYENVIELEGRKVHHIIDPRSGYPVPRVAGVTVVTPVGCNSDVFSTAMFIGGEPMIAKLREAFPETVVLHVGLDDGGSPIMRRYGWRWWPEAAWQNDDQPPVTVAAPAP